jgi:hypothetical protein
MRRKSPFALVQAKDLAPLGVALSLAISMGAAACGGSSDTTGFSNGGSGNGGVPSLAGSGDGGGGSGGLGGSGGTAGSADASADNCPASATLVYVTGEGDKLYSFYPPTQTFTLIGTLSCLTSPTHMTVDRQGNAWVVANSTLYKASTADASCAAVPTWTGSLDYFDFALSFIGVSNTVDNTLFLLNDSGKLSTFDIASGSLKSVGNSSVTNALGDMTSNGDGTLYFLQDVSSPKLYELDPTSAKTMTSAAISATGGGSQALAFWGGRFYAFENSAIFEYDPTAKTTKNIGTAPLNVTGAGQSTCVPKVPPPTK